MMRGSRTGGRSARSPLAIEGADIGSGNLAAAAGTGDGRSGNTALRQTQDG